jgi:CRISPR/Cas system-associated endonuclease/helicase Cas3
MILKIYLERYRVKNMVFPVEMCSIISFMLQVDKGSTGSVPDSFDPYFVSIQDLSTEDASTVPNASDSFSLERLGKKNQDDVNNSHSRGSCNSKWDYGSIIFDADPSDGKMLHDNAASADNQSAEYHQIILDSQEDATSTPEEIQQSYMKEASRPMIAYECQDIFDFDESSLNMDSKRMQCKNELPFSVDMSVKKIDADNATSNGNICEGPMLDPAGSDVVERQKSVKEDASAVTNVMDAPSSAKKSSVNGKADGESRMRIAEGNDCINGC